MENKFFFVRKREISGLGSDDWNFFKGRSSAQKRLRWRAVYFVVQKRLRWRAVYFVVRKDYLKWVAGVALCAIPTLDTHRNDAHSLCGTPTATEEKLFFFYNFCCRQGKWRTGVTPVTLITLITPL